MNASADGDNPARDRAGGPTPVRVVASVVAGLCAAAVPVFLLGALQLRIAGELGMSSTGVGLAIAVFFLAGATCSIPGGRLVDRIGAAPAMRLGMTGTVLATLGVAALARTPGHLMIGMAFGGSVLALIDPSGARAVARRVPTRRQGLAFGFKEASIPLASLFAGLTLPVLGAQVGWRPAFVGAAVLALLTGLSIPRRIDHDDAHDDAHPRSPDGDPAVRGPGATIPAGPDAARHGLGPVDSGAGMPGSAGPPRASQDRGSPGAGATLRRMRPTTLFWLALSAAVAGGVSASVATFLVPTSTRLGLAAGAAGFLLSFASILSIACRIGTGLLVDRRPGSELAVLAALIGTGAAGVAGLAVLSFRTDPLGPLGVATLIAAATLALGAGWGWPGLVFLAAVRLQPAAPARAAGAVLAGLATGGASGPMVTGALADTQGFAATWTAGASAMLLAALLVAILWARRPGDGVPTAEA